MYILVILLATMIALHFLTKKKETYENYDDPSCLQLAKKNETNIDSLQKDVTALLALQTKVQSLQTSTDTNAKQLSSLVNQVYKTPPT
jgi:hypothetical protein